MHSPYKAVVAFSGEKEYGGKMVTEATINGFPSSEIEKKIETDPYRILVVANKFQTGYDQPLLTKYFYKPVQLRSIADITADIRDIEKSTYGLLNEILGR